MGKYRITVDTGGTFSDFVYMDETTGEVSIAKVPSTPDDPSRAILQGIEHLLSRGVKGADISYFCHGTTVGTNALLEGKGARTGLLVTKGFRGIYEVGEQSPAARPGDLRRDVREAGACWCRRSRTGEVAERVAFDGTVLSRSTRPRCAATLRDSAARSASRRSRSACCSRSCIPEHEARVREIVAEEMPGVERLAVVGDRAADPRVLPAVDHGHQRLPAADPGALHRPARRPAWPKPASRRAQAYIMQSNGGMATFGATASKAVTTVLSGPAGGVTAGVAMSRAYAACPTSSPSTWAARRATSR